jgi:predicted secreted hydrolase
MRLGERTAVVSPGTGAGSYVTRGLAYLALAALIAGCAGGGPVLANPTMPRPPVASATPAPPAAADPYPIELPRDDRPHDRLTEWWYYTGHLEDGASGRWGFEFVIFRAERGTFPVSWASHLALTDERAGTFRYDQRSEIGPQVDRSGASPGDWTLAISGLGAVTPAPAGGEGPSTPWVMGGTSGRDRLEANSAAGGFGLSLDLAPLRPPALHDRDGWVDFGPAGGSYYYSRTRMSASGMLQGPAGPQPVKGIAWFDHQWGDFIAVGGGGWDWFAINLDDGTDLTFSLVRAGDGTYPLVYGTSIEPGGRVRHLERSEFSVTSTSTWQSQRTGATYPAAWRVEIPGEQLSIDLRPTVADQELDTRATTGVVYWEGSQVVTARRAGRSLGGQAYVELTGYGPSSAGQAPSPGGSIAP